MRALFRFFTYLFVVTGLAVLFLPAAGASAATFDLATGNVLTLTGGEGTEDVLLTVGDGAPSGGVEINTYETTTGFVELTNAAEDFGCGFEWEGSSTIVCPAGLSRISGDMRGGDDRLRVLQLGDEELNIPVSTSGGAGADDLEGGAGNDVLDAGSGDDILSGCDEVEGDGNDRLLGGDGDDELVGCDGDDYLDGGAGDDQFDFGGFSRDVDGGADRYIGGTGEDRFSYFSRNEPVKISLDGVANDGSAGEGDNIGADIETIGGGWGDDVIVGSNAPEFLYGDLGSDDIDGGGGNDTVKGNEGVDQVDGGAGNDMVDGGCHGDTIIGGSGVDEMISDGGCGTGYEGSADRSSLDVIEAADGETDQLIFCQIDSIWDPEGDTANVDPSDPVTASGPGRCGTIVVFDDPSDPDAGCIVPMVEGKALRKAESKLEKAGCSIGKVTKRRSKAKDKGRVVAQKPKPGTEKPAGAKVKLVVGKGR
jgi:Ca2+-binding RTX toxin-like protein